MTTMTDLRGAETADAFTAGLSRCPTASATARRPEATRTCAGRSDACDRTRAGTKPPLCRTAGRQQARALCAAVATVTHPASCVTGCCSTSNVASRVATITYTAARELLGLVRRVPLTHAPRASLLPSPFRSTTTGCGSTALPAESASAACANDQAGSKLSTPSRCAAKGARDSSAYGTGTHRAEARTCACAPAARSRRRSRTERAQTHLACAFAAAPLRAAPAKRARAGVEQARGRRARIELLISKVASSS